MKKYPTVRKGIRFLSVSLITSFTLFGAATGARTILVHATAQDDNLTYYGADLNVMTLATGVHLDGTVATHSPWPQYTDNYCFLAVVQAIVNYQNIEQGLSLHYPQQSDQGPVTRNPDDEQPGQILYDMDHALIPPDGPLPTLGGGVNRRPYTLANIAYDFGGDPRSQTFGVDYEAHGSMNYHEHIYHTDPMTATSGLAQALTRYHQPVIALVNHAEHSVLVAGVWATGNPLLDPQAQISSLAIFNPWDMHWGQYLSSGNYAQVSYNDWINATNLPGPWGGTTTWFNLPYSSNGMLDPDPSIGMYQAGPATLHPATHHWIGNYVVIQPDSHPVSANFTFDEHDQLMLQP